MKNFVERFATSDPKKQSIPLTPEQRSQLEAALQDFSHEGPALSDFSDLYPAAEIERDKHDIAELKQKFEKEDALELKEIETYAKALEMILMEFSNAWLPGYLSKASEFDDIKRRTDLFLEMSAESGRIARVAIDVTCSAEGAARKLNDILAAFKRGEVGQNVKYFTSELDESMRGQLRMPRIVIGATKDQIMDLARIYLNYLHPSTPELKKTLRQRMEQHPVGRDLRQEILQQLNTLMGLVANGKTVPLGPTDQALVEDIRVAAKLIEETEEQNQKEKELGAFAPSSNRVLESISRALANAEI